MRRTLLALVLVALAVPRGADAQIGPSIVEVRNGAYIPQDVDVQRGGTVTWVVRETFEHTITSDDCDLRDGDPCTFRHQRIVNGETYSFQAPDQNVTIGYYCETHGQPTRVGYPRACGMCGRIIVGAGSPTPTPGPAPTPVPGEVREVPTTQYPNPTAALQGASPGTTVRILPGTRITSPFTVAVPDVTIVGGGTSPEETVLDGGGRIGAAIAVLADGVRVANLSFTRYVGAAVLWRDVTGFVGEDLRSLGTTGGFHADGSTRGRLERLYSTGSQEAAMTVERCLDCDVRVGSLTAEENEAGFRSLNAGGVVLRDSTLTGNTVGVSLRTDLTEPGAPQRGTHVWRSTVEGGTHGIHVSGGWFDRVEANTITGAERYGIVLTGLDGIVYGGRVLGNTVSGSGIADLAWDGLGLDTCFGGNDAASTDPAFLLDTASCDAGIPLGLPAPVVAANTL